MTNIKSEDVKLFWDLFRYVDWEDEDTVELRKIAHDGTWQESVAVQPALMNDMPGWIAQKCARAAGQIGYFMCPGQLNGDQRANDESVKSLVCLSVDIDKGNTNESLSKLKNLFGQPTLVVHSGGFTETNHQKIHVHYRLSEPETDTHKAAAIREAMALAVGGDISFKRIPQVIRIPGSVYDKNTEGILVEVLESDPDAEVDIGDIYDVVEPKVLELQAAHLEQKATLSRNPEQKSERFTQVATEKIQEGGTEDDNRFNRFSEYAGRWVAHARSGDCDVDEALKHVANWNQENMDPPWDIARVEKEFNAILRVDRKNHEDQWQAAGKADPIKPKEEGGEEPKEWSWFDYSANKLFVGKPDPIPFIVDQMIVEGSTHALVADGGIGKTYVALELGLRAAIGPKNGNNMFGFPVLKECVTFMITVEDGKDDLHRRMYNIDKGGKLLKQAEDRFIVLPVADEIYGGLTLVERDQKGNHSVSHAWKVLTEKMEEVRQKYPGHPFIILLDTYSATHHGDENSSAGTNEWFRAATIVKNKYNAATFVTHHIRKTNSEPINTPAEMRQHIRGSNAFQNNCRIVFGMWEMPGSKSLSKEAAGDEEEQAAMQFINFAPLKSNIGIDWSDRTNNQHSEPILTLRRTGSGQPIFDADIHEKRITYKERKKEEARKKAAQVHEQCEAAIVLSVEEHSKMGKPLNTTEITRDNSLTLPYPANEMSRKEIEGLLNKLLTEKRIVRKSIKVGRTRMDVHDVPKGAYALGQEEERANDAVVIEWGKYEYNEDVQEYVEKQSKQKK